MITWLQRNMQRHYKILFGVLLIVIIVSFVFVTNASSGLGWGDRTVAKREFFGYNLASAEDQARLYGDAQLSATLQVGYTDFGAEQIQNYAFQRVAALHLAEQLHLPAATKKDVEDYIRALPVFLDENGQFDASRYTSFRDSLRIQGQVTEADVFRVLSQDVRAGKAQELLGGPGYVLAHDVRTALARMETSWSLGLATADYTAYKPTIAPSQAELTKFFEENSFRYEIGPRVAASAVVFNATDYLAAVQVSEEDIRSVFDAAPSRFLKPADASGAQQLATADDYAIVRDQVEAELKLHLARSLAAKAASDLAYALYEGQAAGNSDAAKAFLASRNVPLRSLAPFTREAGPVEFDQSPEIAAAAFRLNQSRPLSDAVTHRNGAVILLWQETEPSRTPFFNEVGARVTADYIENEKRKRFVELGRTLKSAIETRLKAGDTYEAAAAAAGAAHGLTLKVSQPAPFIAREPAADLNQAVFSTLDRLEKGQVSDMVITAEQGLFVYAIDKQLPDLTEANPQYAAIRGQLAALTARLGASSVIAGLVEEELKRSEPKFN